MLETISNGGIERFDDLHVDDICEQWKARTDWIAAGLAAYESALTLRGELGLDVTVALGYSLVEGAGEMKETFETVEEFENQLDWSPPSLYLFKPGDRTHLSGRLKPDPLPKALNSKLPEGSKSFLLQWTDEDGATRRTVFVEM